MEHARPPSELSSKGPMDTNWKNWSLQFRIYLKASGAINQPTDMKASFLMNLIGPVGFEVAKNFSPADMEDVDRLLTKFEDHFCIKVTEAQERFNFFSSMRQNTETVEQYVNALKIKARNCNFGDLTDSLIKDKIILDIKNKNLKKQLLEEPDLSLAETISLWKKRESEDEDMLYLSKMALERKRFTGKPDGYAKHEPWCCRRCGKTGLPHDKKDCPGWGAKCENCGMQNHLTITCTKPAALKYDAPNPTLKARNSDVDDLMDSLIKDKMILDTKNEKLVKNLPEEPDSRLETLRKIREIKDKLEKLYVPKIDPDTVVKQEYRRFGGQPDGSARHEPSCCNRCGKTGLPHEIQDCPGWGAKCENCGTLNHLASMCTKPIAARNDAQNPSNFSRFYNPRPFAQIPEPNKETPRK